MRRRLLSLEYLVSGANLAELHSRAAVATSAVVIASGVLPPHAATRACAGATVWLCLSVPTAAWMSGWRMAAIDRQPLIFLRVPSASGVLPVRVLAWLWGMILGA